MLDKSAFAKELCNLNSFNRLAEQQKTNLESVMEYFILERFFYDFEYWCNITIKIKPKKEDGSAEDLLSVIPLF